MADVWPSAQYPSTLPRPAACSAERKACRPTDRPEMTVVVVDLEARKEFGYWELRSGEAGVWVLGVVGVEEAGNDWE